MEFDGSEVPPHRATPGHHDVCGCGRQDPRTMSPDELAQAAKSWRRVQRSAARLRVSLESRTDSKTTPPNWVVALSREEGEPVLLRGWEERTVERLDREARAACPCRCHGVKTQEELVDDQRRQLRVQRAAARARIALNSRLGEESEPWLLQLAAEEDDRF